MSDKETAEPAPELKMWLVVRKDLAIPSGKLAVQSGHAFLRLGLLAQWMVPERLKQYLRMDEPKITVGVDNLAGLERCVRECGDAGLPFHLVKDAARTVFTEPTFTVMAVGPCYRNELPKYVARLQMLKDPTIATP